METMDFNDAKPQQHSLARPEHKDALKRQLHSRLKEVLYYLFTKGKIANNTFVIGDVHGNKGESLKVELAGDKTGSWFDFATGEGGDVFTLWGAVHDLNTERDFPKIMSSIQSWLGMSPSKRTRVNTMVKPTPVSGSASVSVPASEPESRSGSESEPESSQMLGAPTNQWNYYDANGDLMVCVYRYDTLSGKQFRPWDPKLRTYKTPEPRPLYNQIGVAKSDLVVLVEGEKCAEALIKLGICATTAMHGANAPINKTDWSPLQGKQMVLWPDHDPPGKAYADKIINKLRTLGVASLAKVMIPDNKPQGWDAADAVSEGLDVAAFLKDYAEPILLTTDSAKVKANRVGINSCEANSTDTDYTDDTEETEADCPDLDSDESHNDESDNDSSYNTDNTKTGSFEVDGTAQESQLFPVFTVGQLLDDKSALVPDLIAPRILTPEGLLVFGGAPKVGKTDFLLNWLVNLSAGLSFMDMTPPRPLKIFYLQLEIGYDYLRERLQNMQLDPNFLPLIRENLWVTPKVHLLLDQDGVSKVYQVIESSCSPSEVDIIVIDPLRNVYDGENENDNLRMLTFLQCRIEVLRYLVNPKAGVILVHHTKKLTKKMVEEDPFQALSGAGSLRSFYTTGMLLFKPDEKQDLRKIMFELRNGKSIPTKLVDKLNGRWQEIELNSERIVRKDYGEKLDAERNRCQDVILQILLNEARKGKLYTSNQFGQAFDGQAGLGGEKTIRNRLDVLTTKGFIKFNRDKELTIGIKSKYGVMCVEDMETPAGKTIDSATGEIIPVMQRVLPTHFKESQTGAILPVENPEVWVYLEDT